MQSSEPRGLVQFSLYGNLSGVTLVHTSGLVWLKVICCDCSAVVFHMVKWECYNINGTLASLHLWVKTTRTLKIKSQQKKINTCICNFFWGGGGIHFKYDSVLLFWHSCTHVLCAIIYSSSVGRFNPGARQSEKGVFLNMWQTQWFINIGNFWLKVCASKPQIISTGQRGHMYNSKCKKEHKDWEGEGWVESSFSQAMSAWKLS